MRVKCVFVSSSDEFNWIGKDYWSAEVKVGLFKKVRAVGYTKEEAIAWLKRKLENYKEKKVEYVDI